jgi:RsiW-degrading membrane proteinase PrsW (M82 family)
MAGIVPVIEEGVKAIGVGLMAYRRPSLAQAYLWGVAGGAGFALAEGLFNSAGGLDVWAVVALLRVGATLLHSVTGGLMGIAWYSVLAGRRWLRGLGLYAASVVVHALWNTLAAGMTLVSLATMSGEMTDANQGLVGMGIFGLLALLLLLALVVTLGLVGLTRYVKSRG